MEVHPEQPICFLSLYGGNTFILLSDVESGLSIINKHMKLSETFEFTDTDETDGCYNAVCLNNGELVEIKDDTEVILLS